MGNMSDVSISAQCAAHIHTRALATIKSDKNCAFAWKNLAEINVIKHWPRKKIKIIHLIILNFQNRVESFMPKSPDKYRKF